MSLGACNVYALRIAAGDMYKEIRIALRSEIFRDRP